jgi:hypothetical protein
MALDVWIGNPTRFSGSPAVSFEPGAYYSFLLPLFEEFAETYGQMIDPYDGAMFDANALAPLIALVDKAQALISTQPEEFEVHMGTNLGSYLEPKNEEIYHSVKRQEYLAFIDRLRSAVLEAKRTGKPLVFFGD